MDQHSHDTASGLDTLREKGHVQQQQVLHLVTTFAQEDCRLDSCFVGDGLFGVDGAIELLAVEEVRLHLLNLGDKGGAADKDDFVDL